MQMHLAHASNQSATITSTRNLNPHVPSSGSSGEDLNSELPTDAGSVKVRPDRSILAEIGVLGCDRIEPLIIASLVTEDPLLLIGPHGTGKSLLLNRISAALGIEWRHYNASILNFDDLIGFPAPREDGTLEYIKTENSIWGANAVFFDEISRCRPDIQNKMFPIVHERRVQGIELEDLRYRWAAMNPPLDESDDGDYLGSEQLDVAFADRFTFVIEMPSWNEFSKDEKKAVVQMDPTRGTGPSSRLRNTLRLAREVFPHYKTSHGEQVSEYVLTVSNLLSEAGIQLSPRRSNMLFRSILAVYATSIPLDLDMNLGDLTYLVLKNSLPMRCTGQEVRDVQLLAAHRSAWTLIEVPKQSSLRAILETKDPVARLKLVITAKDLSKTERSTAVSEIYARATPGSRAAIVAYMFEFGFIGRLNAAVAEELGSQYQKMVEPIDFTESVHAGSMRYFVWQVVEDVISKLDTNDRKSSCFANYAAHLFATEELNTDTDVQRLYHDWSKTSESLWGNPI